MNWRVIHADEYRRMPWKNGGGETTEILVLPPDAGLDDFEFRISMATVASDGPFSAFAGVDRSLCLLDGNGLLLTIDDGSPKRLDLASEPLSFAADAPSFARLVNGPITDFNAMTRRRHWRHGLRRMRVNSAESIELDEHAAMTIVFCQSGELVLEDGTRRTAVMPGETLVVDDRPDEWTLRATQRSAALVVDLHAANR